MSYLGAQPAPLATELDADTVQTADIQDGADCPQTCDQCNI